ncbi:MAG: hypothetical protein ACEQR8_09020 [Cypionkella sp.]
MTRAPRDEAAPAPLDADGKQADTGPVLDTGGSSIDAERAGAGVTEPAKRAAPPETELPPD